MFPVVFKLGFIEARSYYLLWASALLLFVFWTRQRAIKNYGFDYNQATDVLLGIYCAGIIGAYGLSVLTRLPHYLNGELTLSMLFRGLVSWGGMLAGGAVGLFMLHRYKKSPGGFADAAAIPIAAMLAVGRLGCGFEGCCAGIGGYYKEQPWWALHMHYDPAGYLRYPSQFAESLASLAILVVLLGTEKALKKYAPDYKGGVLFPIFAVLYSLYRFFFDSLRDTGDNISPNGNFVWLCTIAVGLIWLCCSLYRIRAASRH